MRELRLIGVHDDGDHLLLAATDDAGDDFQLPIDDALRTALRRTRPRPSADVGSVPVPDELRPRDVQALLRAGVSAEDVAERAGWTVEKVSRYAGPIQAEREYIAGLARAIAVSGGAAGRADSTFGQRVERRLDGRGVSADDVVWDSWRGHDGEWTVICGFPAGGRQRQAAWHFDLRGRTLDPIDDEARWLGEDDTVPGLLPPGHGHDASVYDVEAEGGLDGPRTPPVRRVRGGRTSATAVPSHPAGGPTPAAERPVDLVAAMRERSKSRRRKSRPASKSDFPEDAAPLEHLDTSGEAPPVGSHPRDDEVPEESAPTPSVDELGHDPVTGTADLFADLPVEDDATAADTPCDAAAKQVDVDSAEDTGEADGGETAKQPEDVHDAEPESLEPTRDEPGDESAAAIPDRPSSARKGRPSVPSWDDIMFGRRPGRD